MKRWMAKGRWVGSAMRPQVMGIINATPDSFSDGGGYSGLGALIDRAAELAADGADLLDIGGESTRPGSQPIAIQKELDRVIPAIERISRRLNQPLSVDTTKPEVARAAIDAGASIVNDIQGFARPEMLAVAAHSTVGVVVMHIQGSPATMQDDPTYEDVVGEVREYLATRINLAVQAGITRDRIAIDPGIGFGKTFEHNLALLRRLREFEVLDCPILIGTSRKGFLGRITGRPVADRQAASVASALAAATQGASIVRVHDVRMTADALRVWEVQQGWD